MKAEIKGFYGKDEEMFRCIVKGDTIHDIFEAAEAVCLKAHVNVLEKDELLDLLVYALTGTAGLDAFEDITSRFLCDHHMHISIDFLPDDENPKPTKEKDYENKKPSDDKIISQEVSVDKCCNRIDTKDINLSNVDTNTDENDEELDNQLLKLLEMFGIK